MYTDIFYFQNYNFSDCFLFIIFIFRLKAEKDRASSDSEELKNTKLELEEIKQELRRKNIECKDNEDELIKNKLELEQVVKNHLI